MFGSIAFTPLIVLIGAFALSGPIAAIYLAVRLNSRR
jgi:hypothetical protein